MTWVGHSTFAVQDEGDVFLTDPHWGPRALVPPRLTPPGIPLSSVPEDAFAVLNRLVQKAAMRLRKADFYAGRLSIGVKYLDGTRWDSDMKLVDTQDTVTFLHALDKLWLARP